MKKDNKRVKHMIIGFVIFISITLVSIASILYIFKMYGEKYILTVDELPKDNDAIIVLGAGVRNDGSPSDILADRLETSLEVYNNNCGNVFLLSGDHGREEYNEVRAMKNYIVEGNVEEKDIFMDHAGFSTYDTMYRAKEVFKVKKAIIVTNNYHLPRALYIARKLGIDAYGISSDKQGYQLMNTYEKRELLAQVKDFFYINILKPKPEFLGEPIPVNSSDGRVTEDDLDL